MALRSHTKRARSPGSPGDRPNVQQVLYRSTETLLTQFMFQKRLSLTIDHFRDAQSNRNVTPQSPAGGSRFPSEDWVHQADGLTIDSPNVCDFGLPEDKDEDMNMDADDATDTILDDPSVLSALRPDLPAIQTSQMNFAHAAVFKQQQQHTPHSATSSASTPSGPLVTVLPPTPSIASSSIPDYIDALPVQAQTQIPTRPSPPIDTLPGCSTMLIASPMGSFVSPKKQRFTMGPRADCIKCQMNVKGHSVHY
ncbi:hypothetical protein H0H87_010010 [Tephrocybe sp. NHM501043]|nr:hypothetical protein H0H87_010010 [Tephrocybe sp. NHM501043]